MSDDLSYPFPDYPPDGSAIEVADGIHWLSTPLPFAGLRQVNLWLLRDGDGWAMVDCGYAYDAARAAIAATWEQVLGGRPITRLIVTHFHPDHAGNSGWIAQRWGLLPLMTQAEWFAASIALRDNFGDGVARRVAFFREHGLDEARTRDLRQRHAALFRRRRAATRLSPHRGRRRSHHRRRQLDGAHRRGPFARACGALLRRAQAAHLGRPDPADHHHQYQRLADRARGRSAGAFPRHRPALRRAARSRDLGAAVAPAPVPQRPSPARRAGTAP